MKSMKVIAIVTTIVLLAVSTFALISLAASSRHTAYCQRVKSAALTLYADPYEFQIGYKQAHAFLLKTSGAQNSIKQLRTLHLDVKTDSHGASLAWWQAEVQAVVAADLYAAGC